MKAAKEDDFAKLITLNDNGYKPTADILQSATKITSNNTLIAIEKIFGVEVEKTKANDLILYYWAIALLAGLYIHPGV